MNTGERPGWWMEDLQDAREGLAWFGDTDQGAPVERGAVLGDQEATGLRVHGARESLFAGYERDLVGPGGAEIVCTGNEPVRVALNAAVELFRDIVRGHPMVARGARAFRGGGFLSIVQVC